MKIQILMKIQNKKKVNIQQISNNYNDICPICIDARYN